jgi:hypothetical protein
VRRLRFLWVILAVIAAGAVWAFLFAGKSVEPAVRVPRATATIGSGSEAVAVGPQGRLLGWLPLSEDIALPTLPLSEPPTNGRLAGPVLQQARVLGAAPPALRPYLARSEYGESGIDVELRSGVELRFGDASRAGEKWKAVAAVLADPTVTSLDYVNVSAPGRADVGGSGHTLPPVE